MKKIAIFTLIDYKNYGNRLQNYALLKTLEKFDFSPNTIVYSDEKFKLKKSLFKNFVKKNVFLRKTYFCKK